MDPSASSNIPPRRNTSSPNLESRTAATSNSNQIQISAIPDSAYASTGFFPLRSSSASHLGRTPRPPAPLHQLPLPTVFVSPPPAPSPLQLPPSSSSDAATMSAVAALQFDPVFGMGSRTSYSSWPVIESNNHHSLLGHDLALSYASDTSLSPPSASRSITASPPHQSIILSAQQRELKRQREQVRREAKIASRRQASASTPGSSPSQRHSAVPTPVSGSVAGSPSSFLQSPPVTMADLSASSATGGLPGIYGTTSSAPSQMPLLSEPATTSASLGSPSYLATNGSYSSQMHDHQQPGVFPASYQSQGYMPEYTTASFPASAPTTLHSQYPRGMHDQQSMMYQMPPPSSSSMMSPGHISHHHQQTAHQLPLPQLGHHQQPQHRSPHHGSPHAHQQTTPPLPPHAHAHAHNGAATGPGGHPHHPYEGGIVGSAVGSAGPAGVRVVQSRPRPQCWEHGCNGRQFSTFSNLLRHQREKSGQAAKAVCPNCGAEFTRTTARNGHLQHDKCKQRRSG